MKTCPECGRQNPDGFMSCPECGSDLKTRSASPEDLLTKVVDRKSFIEFVTALAEERAEAERMEREEPIRYQLGGALNWQNGDISSFLDAALAGFEADRSLAELKAPTWRNFAEFLYSGKIYE
jgi:hypothetical protein